MAGAANIHKSYPGKTSESWFPYLMSGTAIISAGAGSVIFSALVPFDCIIRQAYLSVGLAATAHCDAITLKTVDSTALTIVATVDPGATADIVNVLKTLHADVDGVTIVAGNGFQCTADPQAAEASTIQWLLMLEAVR